MTGCSWKPLLGPRKAMKINKISRSGKEWEPDGQQWEAACLHFPTDLSLPSALRLLFYLGPWKNRHFDSKITPAHLGKRGMIYGFKELLEAWTPDNSVVRSRCVFTKGLTEGWCLFVHRGLTTQEIKKKWPGSRPMKHSLPGGTRGWQRWRMDVPLRRVRKDQGWKPPVKPRHQFSPPHPQRMLCSIRYVSRPARHAHCWPSATMFMEHFYR